MATPAPATPPFEDLLARGQQLLSQLDAHNEGMAQDLADRLMELNQARTELNQVRGELNQARVQQRQSQQERDALRTAQQAWAAERERLVAEGERLRKTHEALSADHQALQASHKTQSEELAGLHAEHEQLKELHTSVSTQTSKLAGDWRARRDALTADKERLAAEVAEARKTLVLGKEREKQWKAQVWKLQDEVKTLRRAAGQPTEDAAA